MEPLRSPGLGSGIDIGGLVQQLVRAEGEATTRRLDRREAGLQAGLSGMGLLKGALSGLEGALAPLASAQSLSRLSATVSNPAVLAATAGNGAAAGSFEVEVQALAGAQKLASAGMSSASAAVGTGTLSIRSGESSFEVSIGEGEAHLAGIRDAINAAPGNPGVAASLVTVDDGSGGTEVRLVLGAASTGVASAITVTVSDDQGAPAGAPGLSMLIHDPEGAGTSHLEELVAARDARITIDGLPVSAGTNTIEGAVEGLRLTLLAPTDGVPARVTVSPDRAGTAAFVEQLVGSYNALADTIADLSRFDAQTGERGVLLGDATLRAVSAQLRRLLAGEAPTAGGPAGLSALGLGFGADGRLVLDSARLEEALAANPGRAAEVLAGPEGLATRLRRTVAGFTGSEGSLAGRTEGLERGIREVGTQREALDRRLESLEARLMAQFSAMDAMVARLQQTSSFLDRQFSQLQAMREPRRR